MSSAVTSIFIVLVLFQRKEKGALSPRGEKCPVGGINSDPKLRGWTPGLHLHPSPDHRAFRKIAGSFASVFQSGSESGVIGAGCGDLRPTQAFLRRAMQRRSSGCRCRARDDKALAVTHAHRPSTPMPAPKKARKNSNFIGTLLKNGEPLLLRQPPVGFSKMDDLSTALIQAACLSRPAT